MHMRQLFVTNFCHECLHFRFHIPHCTFSLSIWLRAASARDSNVNSKALMKLFLEIIAEFRAHIVNNAFSRRHVAAVDFLVDKDCYWHSTLIRNGSRQKHFFILRNTGGIPFLFILYLKLSSKYLKKFFLGARLIGCSIDSTSCALAPSIVMP